MFLPNFIDKIGLSYLVKIEKRGHKVYKKECCITPFGKQPIEFDNPTDLKRHLCDVVNVGYCISNEELINEIKSKLP